MYDDTILIKGLNALNIPYTQMMLEQMHDYYEAMVEKNKVMNLTGITEYQEFLTKHWLDSLCFIQAFSKEEREALTSGKAIRVLDVGTGAGFPGIPMKIFFPNCEMVLLDSLNKRIVFLQEVIEKLKLTNVQAIHGRAEEYAGKAEYREQFDLCVSRAVARLASLSELCIPFVKKGGIFASYKAEDSLEEIKEAEKAIHMLGGKVENLISYHVPETDLGRKLVVVRKTMNTAGKYPRGGGKPLKQPLGVEK